MRRRKGRKSCTRLNSYGREKKNVCPVSQTGGGGKKRRGKRNVEPKATKKKSF